MLEIDGSQHSGSGSIVRLAAAYAALTSTPVHVVNARARREPKTGLRRQHCLALVPLLARRGRGVQVELRGGVFQDFAPSAFHLQHVVSPLLGRMGVEVEFRVERPGYVPTGQGILRLSVAPAARLEPLRLEQPGEVERCGVSRWHRIWPTGR
jgi:RNA 3'-terminal phosphate cyclase (ATP)